LIGSLLSADRGPYKLTLKHILRHKGSMTCPCCLTRSRQKEGRPSSACLARSKSHRMPWLQSRSLELESCYCTLWYLSFLRQLIVPASTTGGDLPRTTSHRVCWSTDNTKQPLLPGRFDFFTACVWRGIKHSCAWRWRLPRQYGHQSRCVHLWQARGCVQPGHLRLRS
jgi:hypothetical protein